MSKCDPKGVKDSRVRVKRLFKQMKINRICRSHLKNRILVQGQGGGEVQPAGILKYSEELKRGPNTEIGTKDFLRWLLTTSFIMRIAIMFNTREGN